MISFNDIIDQLDTIRETIKSDTIFDPDKIPPRETPEFVNHLHFTKSWFIRVSWSNKKQFLLALLDDVNSLWTISLLLKSMWNCRTKDALISAKDFVNWSSYDQVPLDHNRTAAPLKILTQVMKEDRKWFMSLNSESQASVLQELLSISGGPILWEFLKRAEVIYETSRDHQMSLLRECGVSPEPVVEKGTGEKIDSYLVNWNATIKTMRNNLKLEEFDLTLEDGTKKRIWKVNRVKPEAIETVDFLQLLPASLGKLILSFLPKANLGDYARVNKYWAFLVEELKTENAVRLKVQVELEKLQDAISRYEGSLERPASSARDDQLDVRSGVTIVQREKFAPYPVRKRPIPVSKPTCKMSELYERLERRGAADSSLFKWCKTLIKERRKIHGHRIKDRSGGFLPPDFYFPSPLLKQPNCVDVPLRPPLYNEPMTKERKKVEQRASKALDKMLLSSENTHEVMEVYKMWNKDFSSLMPIIKIASHQYNF